MPNTEVRNSAPAKSFWHRIITQKFSAPFVIAIVVVACLAVTYLIAREGYVLGIIVIAGLIGVPVLVAVTVSGEFGIITLIVVSFFINFVSRFLPEDTPIGTLMDALTWLLILGFFIRKKNEPGWDRFKDPITYWTIAWIGYNIFEVVNPASPSILEWVFTVRTVGIIMLMYFVFLYHIRTIEFVRILLKLVLVLELIAAIQGFQQENIGLLPTEYAWVHRIPERWKLLFIGGHLRKWGPFSDPVVYAYNMVAAALICIALILGKIKMSKKIILGIMVAFFFMVMLYSGTRASYVIIPAALVMLAILNFNKKIFAFLIVSGFILAFLVFVPTSNPTLARFQSAFKPSKDRSFEERAKNQEMIKPYILSHPIGGGLGSVGVWGQRFAPGSYLAKFPPDSGYVRVAVEMGWIGLLLYCTFTFVIMYMGIRYFYLIKDPELKTYCLAMILFIFAFDVGNYPQQAIVQYPSNILYYLAMALLNVLMRLDKQKREETLPSKTLVPAR